MDSRIPAEAEALITHAKTHTLGRWERGIIANGPSSIVITIPFEIRHNLNLLPGTSRALLNRITPSAFLLELLADPDENLSHSKSSPRIYQIGNQARTRKTAGRTGTDGFTLVELLIAVSIIALIAAAVVPRLYGRNGSQQAENEIVLRLRERRAAARHLSPKNQTVTTWERFQRGYRIVQTTDQPPLLINFSDPESTRPLRVEGTDANQDFLDDETGLPLTRYNPKTHDWAYAYEGEPMQLPSSWHVVNPSNPITDGSGEVQGIPVFSVAFDSDGRPWGYPTIGNNYTGPTGPSAVSPDTLSSATGEAKFWTVYLTDGNQTVGIAVHGTGLVETWRLTENGWKGWRNRNPNSGEVHEAPCPYCLPCPNCRY